MNTGKKPRPAAATRLPWKLVSTIVQAHLSLEAVVASIETAVEKKESPAAAVGRRDASLSSFSPVS